MALMPIINLRKEVTNMASEPFLINPMRRLRRNAMELDPYSGEFESVPLSYEYGGTGGKMKKRHKRSKSKKRSRLSLSKFVDKSARKHSKKRRKMKRHGMRKSMLKSRAIRSVKRLGRSGSKHVVRAISRGGHWFTSPKARMVRPNLRLNPFSESLMLVGSNPKRRKGGKSMARRMRRNPLAVVKQVTDMAQPIGVGILAMALPERIANYIDPLGGYMNLGARLGVIVGGNFAVKAITNSTKNAELWLLFGIAKLAKDLADKYIFNPLVSMVVPTSIPANMPGVAGLSAPIFPNGNRMLSSGVSAPVRPLRNFKGNLYNINA